MANVKLFGKNITLSLRNRWRVTAKKTQQNPLLVAQIKRQTESHFKTFNSKKKISAFIRTALVTYYHRSQRGTKSHLKIQFPPEMTLFKSQQNFQTRLKSNFLFTPISNICFKQFSRWMESRLASNTTKFSRFNHYQVKVRKVIIQYNLQLTDTLKGGQL